MMFDPIRTVSCPLLKKSLRLVLNFFKFFKTFLIVAYVHIEYSTYQFSGESPPGPYGIKNSVVLRGLIGIHSFFQAFLVFNEN